MDNLRYGCSICGHKQNSLSKCEYCGSIRVVDIAFSEQITGIKWEDNFK
jgi:primosomal protein N'